VIYLLLERHGLHELAEGEASAYSSDGLHAKTEYVAEGRGSGTDELTRE